MGSQATSPSSDAGRKAAGRLAVALVGVLGAAGAGAVLHLTLGQLAEDFAGVFAWAGIVGGVTLAFVIGLVVVVRAKRLPRLPVPFWAAAGLLLCVEVAITSAAVSAMRPAGSRFLFMMLSVIATLPPVTFARTQLAPRNEAERPITDAVDL